MERLPRVVKGIVSLVLGAGAIWLAVAGHRLGKEVAPLAGELRWQDYVQFLALGSLGVAFLAVAYVYLFRSPRA
jgi:hypothetical protein